VDEHKMPRTFSITATYGFAGRTVTEVTPVDLRPYRHMHTAFDPLVTALGKITDAINKKS